MIELRNVISNILEARQALLALTATLNRIHGTYGLIGLSSPPQAQTLPAASTKITAFNTEEGVGVVTSHANNKITISRAGLYQCGMHISLEAASGSSAMVFAIRKNNTAEVASQYAPPVGTDIVSASCVGVVNCVAGDEIEVYEAGGQNVSYDIHRLSLWVKQLSGV